MANDLLRCFGPVCSEEVCEFFYRLAKQREAALLQISLIILAEQIRQDRDQVQLPLEHFVQETQYSRTTARKYVRLLEELHFVRIEHRGGRPSDDPGRGDFYGLAFCGDLESLDCEAEWEETVEEKAAPTRGPTEKRPGDVSASSGRQFWFVCLRQQASHHIGLPNPLYPKTVLGCKP